VSSIAAISALALVGLATPALADVPSAPAQQPSTANPPAAKKAPPPAKPTLICRSQVTTGSLLPVRECHTAEQWADIRTHGKDQLGLVAARPNGLGGQ
jgi:hypothetical protein